MLNLEKLRKEEYTFIDEEFNLRLDEIIDTVEFYNEKSWDKQFGIKFQHTQLLSSQLTQRLTRTSDPIETLKIDARFKCEAQVFAHLTKELLNGS